jgi:hypothetical protein
LQRRSIAVKSTCDSSNRRRVASGRGEEVEVGITAATTHDMVLKLRKKTAKTWALEKTAERSWKNWQHVVIIE